MTDLNKEKKGENRQHSYFVSIRLLLNGRLIVTEHTRLLALLALLDKSFV